MQTEVKLHPSVPENNQLDLRRFAETLGRIWGRKHGMDISLCSITNKATGEVIYVRGDS